MKYGQLEQNSLYNGYLAGAIVGVTFILASDPSVRFTGQLNGGGVSGGLSGFTVSSDMEALPVETLGTRIAEEIVQGRFSGTLATNGFFNPLKGDDFIPSSTTFVGKQWHVYRFFTEGDAKDLPIDAVTFFTPARANIAQGPRNLVTFDMNGPIIERLSGREAAKRFGLYK